MILVLALFSTEVRFFWRRVLHSYVEESDSYGLTVATWAVAGLAAGLVAWVVCWFLLRLRRTLLVGQVVAVLMAPVVVSSWSIGEALQHPAARHEALAADQAAADRAAALGVATYWRDLPAWLRRIPGGAAPWFPPVPAGRGVTWRGTEFPSSVFPSTGSTSAGSGPFRDRQVAVVSGSPTELLLLAAHREGPDGRLRLVDVPLHGPVKLLADAVTGAAAAPDGRGYAYSTDRAVTARLGNAARPVVLPRAGLVLRGWGSDGVVLQQADGTLLRWHPDDPARAPETLVVSTGAVQVPPRGHRMLQRPCLQPYDAAGVTAGGQPEPYVGFDGGVWPVTLPVQVESDWQPCQQPHRQNLLTASGLVERPAPDALALSPDGRYLLLAGLQVLDLDGGTRTSLVDAATQAMFLTVHKGFPADPIGTGFWHDDRTVEITAGGSPVAVCALPAGPCRSTGAVLPRLPLTDP